MFPPSRLYAIVDTGLLRQLRIVDAVEALLAGGVRLLQYRHKGPFMRREIDDCLSIVRLAGPAGALVFVNDRADIAVAVGAAGVHVGQEDLPPDRLRRFLPADRLIGFSTHSVDQAREGARSPIDYLAIGPVFPTTTKDRPDPVIGLDTVRACKALLSETAGAKVPLVAIGGITLENAPQVLAAGADAVAVASDLVCAGDIAARARQYIERLDS